MSITVRETPPLRVALKVDGVTGKQYHWSPDSPDPTEVPSGLSWSTTMPGGFEQLTVQLSRRNGDSNPDFERFANLRVESPGGGCAWEGRIDSAPLTITEGVEAGVTAVGWQSHLEDNKNAAVIYVDRDLSRWTGPSRQRELQLLDFSPVNGPEAITDVTSGMPALKLSLSGELSGGSGGIVEGWYDAGAGCRIAIVAWETVDNKGMNDNFQTVLFTAPTDSGGYTKQIDAKHSNPVYVNLSAPARYAMLQIWHGRYVDDSTDRFRAFRQATVIGDHGLPVVSGGIHASNIIRHAVRTFAPRLDASGVPADQGFIVPHLVYTDPTSPAEIVKGAAKYGLDDWAVWEDRRMDWNAYNTAGREWRARVGPAKLEQSGRDTDRIYNGIVVQYTDVSGVNMTVGPPGSRSDTEDPILVDSDESNPASRAQLIKWERLQVGTSTAAAAVEIGRRFIEQSRVVDRSGRATLTGHVEDSRGVMYPYHAVRAGDRIRFVDAADTSPRRIVKTSCDEAARSCSVDLDAPPEGLDAVLERLNASMAPLGL